jgi:tetratricopeptide (TPR) repeat protein
MTMTEPRPHEGVSRSGRSSEDQRQRTPTSGAPPPSSYWPLLAISLGLVAANLVVYVAVRRYDFVYFDDQLYVTENPTVAAGLTWRGVAWAFTTGHASNWHPLTWLSHMLDVQLYGMHAGGHHLTNLLLHIVNTLLLFGVLHRMTGAMGRSGFVAALFAVHPLHVESVAWVAERKDVLSTLFWMLTLWSYISYVRQPRRGRYGLVIVLFALGLMAKPMLVTLPFVLLLLDYWPLGRATLASAEADQGVTLAGVTAAACGAPRTSSHQTVWFHLLREKVPLFALAAASSVVTFSVQHNWGSVIPLDRVPLDYRVANALVSYVAYIGKMLWPARLAAFYAFVTPIPVWRVFGAAVLLLATCAATLRTGRRRPYLLVGWLWYVGTLVPVIGLVQIGIQRMADRYTYVPMIGLSLIVAWGASDLLASWRHRRITLAITAAFVLVGCVIAARGQVHSWESSVALWQHAVDVSSDDYWPHNRLAAQLAAQGKLDEAIAHYAEAVRIRPRSAYAHLDQADALSRAGRMDEAIAQYSEALRIRPNFEEAHNGLGVVLMRKGNHHEANAHLTEAIRLRPGFADAHHNLAVTLAREGRLDEAIPEMLRALQIKPDQAGWHYELASMYRRNGNEKAANAHFERTLTLRALRDLQRQGAR